MGTKIPKVIKEVAESGIKANKKTLENIAKNIDGDIAKGLSKKGAKESAELFVGAGESKLESMLRMAGDDPAVTKSILRDYKKNRGTFKTGATPSSGAARKSAEVFESATHSGNDVGKIIGDKNPFYVETGGNIDKRYQKMSTFEDKDKAAFLSTERGITESFDEIYSASSNNTNDSVLRKKEELENLKHRIRKKEGLNSENATGSGNKAQRRADEINAKREGLEKETRERLEKTKDERLKNIQDQMEEAGMFGHRPEAKLNYDTSELKGRMHESKNYYMKYKAAEVHDEALKILDLKDKKPKKFEEKARNNPVYEKLKGDKENFDHITRDQIVNARKKAILDASEDQMGLIDHMGYHKVPQKAVAGVSTFWLVNKLASGNGQQTNAQLYGQQPYY